MHAGHAAKQISLEKHRISEFHSVSLHVSSAELSIRYSAETQSVEWAFATLFSPLAGLLMYALEPAADKTLDEKRAQDFESIMNPYEKILGKYFVEEMEKADVFKIRQLDKKTTPELKQDGYDACIELNIEELSLRKEPYSDKCRVHILVNGKMIDLREERLLWEKNENVLSEEEYTIDEYKENLGMLGQIIDRMLRKIAGRLACDIAYS